MQFRFYIAHKHEMTASLVMTCSALTINTPASEQRRSGGQHPDSSNLCEAKSIAVRRSNSNKHGTNARYFIQHSNNL